MTNVKKKQKFVRKVISKKKLNIAIGSVIVAISALVSFLYIPAAIALLAVGLGWLCILGLAIVSELQNYSRSIWRSVLSYDKELKKMSSRPREVITQNSQVPPEIVCQCADSNARDEEAQARLLQERFDSLEKSFHDFLVNTLSKSIQYERNGIPLSILKLKSIALRGEKIGCICLPAHSEVISEQMANKDIISVDFLSLDGKAPDVFPQTWTDLIVVLPDGPERELVSCVDSRLFRWVPRDARITLLSDSESSIELLSRTLDEEGIGLAVQPQDNGVYKAVVSFIDRGTNSV